MKILLIQPNTRYCYNGLVVAHVPHGLLYVAASLRQAGFEQIGVLDARMERLNRKELSRLIKEFSPDVVGITALSVDASEAHVVAALARKNAPGCKVVVGGPYTSSNPEAIVGDPNVDFAVIGEGERTACELVSALERGADVSGIAGLAYRGPGGAVFGPPREMIEEVDDIPLPAWDLLDMERYFGLWSRHSLSPYPGSGRILPLFTSRGCPYGCVYCHNLFGKKARLRSAEEVLREIELLVNKYGVEEIEIVDDIFNIDLPRAKLICDEIVRRGIKIGISFPQGLRADRMDEELVAKLRRAGTRLLFYAVESASPRVQKQIRKDLDLEKAARIIKFTAEQGILVGGFFMLGFPGETREEMQATARFARDLPFHIATFFYVTPYPNTELYTMAAGSLKKAGKGDFFKFAVNLSAVPDREFQRIRETAYARFYYRPWQLWRIFRAVPNRLYVAKLVLRAFFLGGWA
ncbi:MAG: radical SAM protein [Elusimicrobiota bacterium]|nr:radical SAM protein [Elusimicrobiota bacterium]